MQIVNTVVCAKACSLFLSLPRVDGDTTRMPRTFVHRCTCLQMQLRSFARVCPATTPTGACIFQTLFSKLYFPDSCLLLSLLTEMLAASELERNFRICMLVVLHVSVLGAYQF